MSEKKIEQDRFDSVLCEKYVRLLVDHDEVERAILVLDNLPAYHRENTPDNLMKLREEILRNVYTPHRYMHTDDDSNISAVHIEEFFTKYNRGVLIKNEVRRFNLEGKVPHLVDMGPGNFCVPIGLRRMGMQFTYKPLWVCHPAYQNAKPYMEGISEVKTSNAPTFFIANEIIEHLPNVNDIAGEALKHCGDWPERVHMSTPHYCYDPDEKDYSKGLPHLRAYTMDEFYLKARALFPNYQWHVYDGQILSLRGCRADSIDKEPL